MGIKYQSKHTGAELDEALDYSLLHKNKGSVHILDSSNESITDLNTLINPGVYATQYVTNAKSGLDSFDCVIEIVNETTVIFHNVVKIEIKNNSNRPNEQVTYIYDMKNSTLIKVARGSFEVELPMGKYLML